MLWMIPRGNFVEEEADLMSFEFRHRDQNVILRD